MTYSEAFTGAKETDNLALGHELDDTSLVGEEVANESMNGDEDECFVCERATRRKCFLCGKLPLCGKSCEEQEVYVKHTLTCSKRPVDSADYIGLAVLEDQIPTDPDTCEDFGFSAFPSFYDQCKLLGLYKGLIYKLALGVSTRTLHTWQVNGILKEKIIETYNTRPEGRRGSYFPWFLQNLHCLDTNKDEIAIHREAFLSISRKYLIEEDRDLNVANLEPEAKRQSIYLYVQILHGWHPIASQDIWFEFGFCTCVDEHKERKLGPLYKQLIERCSFQEFWTAFEEKTLMTLFDRYDLGYVIRHDFKHLEKFLSTPMAGGYPSVWTIYRFICEEGAEADRTSLADYGFLNCKNARDRLELKNVYKRLLVQADPLELHQACLRGHLYEFATRCLEIEPRFQCLMQNLYPLPMLSEG